MPAKEKHGVRKFLSRGLLPMGCEHVAREGNKLQNALERAVLTRRTELTEYESCLIDTARKHEIVGRLLMRWLGMPEAESLTIEQRLAIFDRYLRASMNRDACVKQLRLDGETDIIDAIYREAADDGHE